MPPTPPAPGAQGKTHGAFIGISWDNVVFFFKQKLWGFSCWFINQWGFINWGHVLGNFVRSNHRYPHRCDNQWKDSMENPAATGHLQPAAHSPAAAPESALAGKSLNWVGKSLPSGNDCYIANWKPWPIEIVHLPIAWWIFPVRYGTVYQRVNLHFPMVFRWFSYGFLKVFLWFSAMFEDTGG